MKKFKELSDRFDKRIKELDWFTFFVFSVPFWFVICFIVNKFMFESMATNVNDPKFYTIFNTNLYIKLSFTFSVIISLMGLLMRYQMRKAEKFWEAAKKLDEDLISAVTKQDVIDLHPRYNELRTLAQAPPHYTEVIRLKGMIEMKQSLIK